MGRTRIATQLLVDPEVKTRMEALAIVRGEKQAEVCRRLIDLALPGLEEAHAEDLAQLREAAEAMDMDLEVLTARMMLNGLTLAAVKGLTEYPYPSRRAAEDASLDAAERRRRRLEEQAEAEKEAEWRRLADAVPDDEPVPDGAPVQ